MIIRIMGEGQFEVPEDLMNELNVIDNLIVGHVEGDREEEYRRDLSRLVATIRARGKPLDPAEIVESHIIVPPEDLSLEEARDVFSGDGLIED